MTASALLCIIGTMKAEIGFNDVSVADFEIPTPTDPDELDEAVRDAVREFKLKGTFWVEFDNGALYLITAHDGELLSIMYVKER